MDVTLPYSCGKNLWWIEAHTSEFYEFLSLQLVLLGLGKCYSIMQS